MSEFRDSKVAGCKVQNVMYGTCLISFPETMSWRSATSKNLLKLNHVFSSDQSSTAVSGILLGSAVPHISHVVYIN